MGSRKKTSGSFEQIAYRFFGIPSDRDAVFEKQTFGCCRYLWNRMLGDHNTLYREIGYVPQNTPADYKDLDECCWLQDADSSALANVQLNLETAFSRFYKQISRYPKFKSKKSGRNSYTTSASYHKTKHGVTCNIRLDEKTGMLILPKHKDPVALIVHRKIRPGGKLKSVTVTLEPDGKTYYSILFAYPKTVVSKPEPKAKIGLDMSLPKLYVDNNGHSPVVPKPYRDMEANLAREQKKLSRKQEGSRRYEKQRLKVAKLHAKIKHQRQDILHKLSCNLTDQYDLIAIENLNMSAIKRSLNFGKLASDLGWGMFVNMLTYKAERKGKWLIKVDRWFPSSKTCCHCGYIHKELALSDRTYVCPRCGHTMDRDAQAAINILNEAIRMLHDVA